MSDFKSIIRWSLPNYYYGKEYPEYYVFLGRHRDSDYIQQSNFIVGLERLGGENAPDVIIARASHWGVGWVEDILIHESCIDKLKHADEMLNTLSEYALLDDVHWCNLRIEEVRKVADEIKQDLRDWRNLNVWGRYGLTSESNDEEIYSVADDVVKC